VDPHNFSDSCLPIENWNYFFVLGVTWGHCNPYLNSLFRFKRIFHGLNCLRSPKCLSSQN
jgi:hypothetical protein